MLILLTIIGVILIRSLSAYRICGWISMEIWILIWISTLRVSSFF